MDGAPETAPEVMPEAADILAAFWSLVWDRSLGYHSYYGGLPFTAIECYARRLGLTDSEFWRFESLIRACDTEWRRWANAAEGKRPLRAGTSEMTPEAFDKLFG